MSYYISQKKKLAILDLEVFSDLPGHSINGATIPPDIFVASCKDPRPDLDLVNRKEKKIAIMELTCPLEQNIDKANTYKTTTYTPLKLLNKKFFKWNYCRLKLDHQDILQITTRRA